ncbi:MAG: hypothetical protein WCK42_04120 [Myxococcaceae bacterium]
MKNLKKASLMTLLVLSFAVSGLAHPDYRGPDAPFSARRIDINRDDPSFDHMRRIGGHRDWNHYHGGLYYGPVWNEPTRDYHYWDPVGSTWIAGAGLVTGAAVGLALGGCCS